MKKNKYQKGKTIFIMVCIILIFFNFSMAQTKNSQLKIIVPSDKKCNCIDFPFKPDSCVAICLGKIIKNSTALDLSIGLGLSDSTTKNLIAYKNSVKTIKADELEKLIPEAEFLKFNNTLRALDKKQLKYFSLPADGKRIMMANYEKLDKSRLKG